MTVEPSVTISLAGRVGHLFDPQTMLQGFVCHGRGVDLASCTAERVAAQVRGKRAHDVILTARAGALGVSCTCPARGLGQAYCKHLWAVLLAVDRHGGLDALRTTRAPLALAALEEPAPPRRPKKPTGDTVSAAPPPKRRRAKPS